MNNKILNLAIAVSQVMRSFLVFIFIVVIVLGVILLINSESLPFLGYAEGTFNFSNQGATSDEQSTRPEGWLMIFAMLKMALTILCSILILSEILKVINSIRSLETFKNKNIIAFRRMGNIFLLLFFVQMFSLIPNGDQLSFRFSVPLFYLLAVMGCYILAEIFKEGNKLMEENQLTI